MDSPKYSLARSRRVGSLIYRPGRCLTAALFSVVMLMPPAKLRADETLYTNPAKTVRIEQREDGIYVVQGNNGSQRAKLPGKGEGMPDEFHLSPDGAWLYGLRHVGSGLRAGELFELTSPTTIVARADFDELAWKNATKLGATPQNFSANGSYAMAAFYAWSIDSKRLLASVRGGDKKGSLREGFFYFNTQTKKFELTDYLRKLTKLTSPGSSPPGLPCAEPITPLPSKEDLAAHFEKLDQQLNKAYKERLVKVDKDRVANLRDAQRTWLKLRDEGLKLYLGFGPAVEQEKRRLQYLGDVTAARLDEFSRPLDQDL